MGAVIQVCIPSQHAFVATVPFYPHKSPRSKLGRKTGHPHINSQPKCNAKGQCWSFVTVPLFADGDTEALNGAMTSLSLQSQREAPGGVTGSAPTQVAIHLDLLPGTLPRCSAAEKTNIRSHLQPHFPSWAVSRPGFPSRESPKAIPHGQENQGGNDKDPAIDGNRKHPELWFLGSGSAKVGGGELQQKGRPGI